MRSLHCKRHAHAESRQRYHRRGAHTYENHLPEDRRDLEKLTRERRNENPVKQTEIKLEIIFQSESGRCAFKESEIARLKSNPKSPKITCAAFLPGAIETPGPG